RIASGRRRAFTARLRRRAPAGGRLARVAGGRPARRIGSMRRLQKALTIGLRGALGVLFVWAGLAKLGDAQQLAPGIANCRMLPASLGAPAAVALPGVEIAAGLALVLGRWLRAAGLLAAGLLAVFAVAVASALGRGINLECGCFGGTREIATWWTFARDVALFGAAGFVALRAPA